MASRSTAPTLVPLLLALPALSYCTPKKSPTPPVTPTVNRAEVATPEAFPDSESFTRHSCSPSLPAATRRGLAFRTKKTLVWGESIPICGHLRAPKEIARPAISSSFSVHVRLAGQEAFHRDSANFQLGDPPIRRKQALYDVLEANGELFFNTRVANQYTTLGPGAYDLSVRYFDIESERTRISIIPGGWRGELAEFLTEEFCRGKLASDFTDYLSIYESLSTADVADEAALAAMQADQAKAAKTAYARYQSRMRPHWVEGLRTERRVDMGVPIYVESRIRTSCPARPAAASIVPIYEAIRSQVVLPP